MMTATETRESVREYYGRVLGHSSHLKTDACCSPNELAPHLKEILRELAPEVVERFYGCGSPIPLAIEGCTVLDLGCGTGRDAYLCSKLVGPHGRVIGVDMTEEQLRIAKAHQARHASRFGYSTPNTRFVHGYMEALADAGIEDASIDVVISNCVINLAPDKGRVIREILRVLKPGGEIHISDVFADRRLPGAWRADPVLLGECLAGATYLEDFRRLLSAHGVPDFRIVACRDLAIAEEAVRARVGPAKFTSLSVRAFKLDSLEDRCEDYGQIATYQGTITQAPHEFVLDQHHVFTTGKPLPVCGNTAAMLCESRYAPHFVVQGDRSRHYGLFPCGAPTVPRRTASDDRCC